MLGRVWRNLNHPTGRRRYARKLSFPATIGAVSLFAFGTTMYATAPVAAPYRQAVVDYVTERTTDQNYRDCGHARSRGRTNIPRWDPSYRERMDRDGDGLACEPYLGG